MIHKFVDEKKNETAEAAAAARGRKTADLRTMYVVENMCVYIEKRQALPLKVDHGINAKKTRFSHVNFKWIAAKISHSWYGWNEY